MTEEHVVIDTSLVRHLIASQFPQWKELSLDPVATSGWDNRTFRLGKDKSVRLPSAKEVLSGPPVSHYSFLLP